MNRPRAVGTAAETAVVRYLRTAGFPHAERRSLRGTLDAGDITGTPGVCWEVKGGAVAKTASDGQVARWLEETDRERVNAGADVGVLVLARAGIGPANAGRWWAIPCRQPESGQWFYVARYHLLGMTIKLRLLGYGEPLERDIPEVAP